MVRDLVYGSKKILDGAGQRIDFNGPYFDKALRRQFNTVEEKASFMRENKIVQNGDSDSKVARERREHEQMKKDLGKDWAKGLK